jgi:hypothetical protein
MARLVEGCARRRLATSFRVVGEHLVELLKINVCEMVFEARGYSVVIGTGGSASESRNIVKKAMNGIPKRTTICGQNIIIRLKITGIPVISHQ